MLHYIFDCNYGNSLQILILSVPLEGGMNTLQSTYKIVSLQFDYVSTLPGKSKNSTKTADRLLQYILFNRSLQTFAESRSMFLYFPVF